MAWARVLHEATKKAWPPSPLPGHVHHHTCFIYSPNDVSTSSPPLIAYISKNGDILMRDIDIDWTKNPRIVVKELVTSR